MQVEAAGQHSLRYVVGAACVSEEKQGVDDLEQDIIVVTSRAECFLKLHEALCCNKMDVIEINNVADAKAGLKKHSPAFLLLDYDIIGGSSLLRELMALFLRPHPYTIVAALFPTSESRAYMLRKGADACVGKPIVVEEVLAVIEAAFRRERRNMQSYQGPLLPNIRCLELTIDPLRRKVTMRGDEVALTVKEFEILYTLASQAGTVLSKEEIYKSVWDANLEVAASIVTDHISAIRKKLGLSSRNNDYIETVFGVGYRFRQPNIEKLS